MMSPEEVQRTIDFILLSHANSTGRMDRLEENLTRLEGNVAHLETNVARHDETLTRIEENLKRGEQQLRHQRETVDVLVRLTQDLMTAMQEVASRTKRLEIRADSVDAMLQVFRELLERNLRPPEGSTS